MGPTGRGAWSVDVELVAFGVAHRHGVVVDPLLVQDLQPGGAEGGEPAGFGVDPLPADLERRTAPAAGVDVDVQPVLDRLVVGHPLEPDPRAVAFRVGD